MRRKIMSSLQKVCVRFFEIGARYKTTHVNVKHRYHFPRVQTPLIRKHLLIIILSVHNFIYRISVFFVFIGAGINHSDCCIYQKLCASILWRYHDVVWCHFLVWLIQVHVSITLFVIVYEGDYAQPAYMSCVLCKS